MTRHSSGRQRRGLSGLGCRITPKALREEKRAREPTFALHGMKLSTGLLVNPPANNSNGSWRSNHSGLILLQSGQQ